jgi:Na+-transporting methylmalonyl-CoA/oxaloacetate decarboxylase gamma subunit
MLKKTIIALMFCGAMAIMPMAAQDAATPTTETEMAVASAEGEESAEVATEEITAEAAEAVTTQAEKAERLSENDPHGTSLTLMSMCIVIFALVVLSLLFLGFGKISSTLQGKRKKEARKVINDNEEELPDSGEAIAAIAAALAEHFSGKHDMEDTILTIKRMKRAYSPWNSKIYNMRVVPELKKNSCK